MLEDLGSRRRRGEPRRRLGGRHAQHRRRDWPPSPRPSSWLRDRPTRPRLEAVSRRVLEEASELSALDLMAVFDSPEPGDRDRSARSSPNTTCSSPRRWGSCRRRTARCNTTTRTTRREAGAQRSSTTGRSPWSSTSPVNPRSACRWHRARTDSRSACSSSPPTAARTCCFSSPPSSKKPCPGSTVPPTPTLADADLTHPSGPSPRTTPRRV